ncbi:ABC transporter substrate-binding protein [Cyanobium sp. FGCU-6]|jgi:NitT/TauT family transport system substrate-binding protein|nr:ABC transporter substrate-binding protein [Cyanobium sp. FGCU6]
MGVPEPLPEPRAPSPTVGRRRRGLLLGLLALLALLPAACPRPSREIRLVLNDWPGYEYFRLARQKGFLDPSRLDLRLLNVSDQAAQVTAYLEGRADALGITSVDAVQICARRPQRCPVLVFVINESRGGDRLLAPPAVTRMAELVGRPIGVEDSALAVVLLHRAFQLHGLPVPSPALERHIPPAQVAEALRSGTIAAVLTYPPLANRLQERDGLEALFTTRDLPGEILDVLAVDPAVLRQRPEAVAALIEGWRLARRWENSAGDSVRLAMARRLGLTPEELELAQQGVLYPGLQEQWQLLRPGASSHRRDLERIRQELERIGRIPPKTPLPALDARFVFSPLPPVTEPGA